MIGKLILIAALVAAVVLAQRWLRKTSLTASQRGQAIVLVLMAVMLILAVSGKLNPLFATLAAIVPILWKLFTTVSRHLPAALKAWQLFNDHQGNDRQGSSNSTRAATSTSLGRTEALQILGLADNASRDDIINAHRRLIQKMHPDRGGSDYLAARINLAKDVLLSDRK